MNWSDERYVRIYTRDTSDWLSLSFLAQGLFCLLLRKVDRAGVLQLGRHGRRAVAISVGHAGDWVRLEPALDELLADGCVTISGDFLTVPNFIEAQEAPMSDAARQRESREKRKSMATVHGVTNGHETGHSVTNRDEMSQAVTPSHTASQPVTPSVPSQPSPPSNSRLPSKDELAARKHPTTQALLDLLADEGYGLTHPKAHAAELEEALKVLGIEDVARGLAQDLASNQGVQSLGYYAKKLIAAAKRPTPKAPGTAPAAPTPDLSWIDSLPADAQAAARAEWDTRRAGVEAEFKPDARPRVLSFTADALRQEFAQ